MSRHLGAGMSRHDIVFAGAGHNNLVAAAYAARAGFRVLVLEGAPQIGGDTTTQELTLPGFLHDPCATAHNLIQSNPLMRNNELELDRHGLKYLYPDPVFTMPFLDGSSITMWRTSKGPAPSWRDSPRQTPSHTGSFLPSGTSWPR